MKILWTASLLLPFSCHAFAQWPGPGPVLDCQTPKQYSSTIVNGASTHSTKSSSDPTAGTCVKTADVLSLDSIRDTLIRQEETIIFALIERAQFRRNAIGYQRGGFGDLGLPLGSSPPASWEGQLSFLEFMMIGTEVLHCSVRRYTSPEEHAFFPFFLPQQGHTHMDALPDLDYPQDLLSPDGGASQTNFNPILWEKYIDVIVPSITKEGDDEQHGSTILADIAVLQALSKRVHYGKFVAESKYRSDPEHYQLLVEAGDAEGVMELLTNEKVEKKVLRRARLKAATYGKEPLLAELPPVGALQSLGEEKEYEGKVDPAIIERIYQKIIIPMTKDVEVAYLFRRCGREPPMEYAPDRMSIDVTEL